jgi:hypothetical protein
MPAGEQGTACALGAERFEEFAAQVARRVDLGIPLIRETIDRVSATRTDPSTNADREPSGTEGTVCERDVQESSVVDDASIPAAAVREDAATLGWRAVEAALFLQRLGFIPWRARPDVARSSSVVRIAGIVFGCQDQQISIRDGDSDPTRSSHGGAHT